MNTENMGIRSYSEGKVAFNKWLIALCRPLYCFFKLHQLGVTVKVVSGHIPRRGGLLIVSHHEEDADPFLVQKAVKRRLNWIAAPKFHGKSVLEYPLLKMLMDKYGIISIDPQNPSKNKGLFQYISILLKRGEVVVIFPESNLRKERKDKRLGCTKDGVIRIAQFAQKKIKKAIPIYPIGLEYVKRGTMTEGYVRIGSPFFVKEKENSKKAMVKLMNEIVVLSNIKNS